MAARLFDRASVSDFPAAPGVYLFFDEAGKVVYVGKAANLRSRVRSYFSSSGDGRLVSRLLKDHAQTMDFVLCGSEKEALILENSLIKKHAPRFNVRLRDDKTYFSLRLDRDEEWPMLRIVRRRRRDGAIYFGPYTSAQACRRTIQYLGGIIPLRTCPDSVLHNRVRPCISYEIGHCTAPCVGHIERGDYLVLVDRVIRFLRGQDQEVLRELEGEMRQAADRLEFERATELRDRLLHMRKTLESPRVTRRGGVDRDVVGLYDNDQEIVLSVLHIRDGNLAASATFHLPRLAQPDAVLSSFLGQFYGVQRPPPAEILMPQECAEIHLHREILEEHSRAAVRLRVPERGEGLRLLRLAERNAQLASRRRVDADERREETLRALQTLLHLLHTPELMECYDISHHAGEHVVGSRVTFQGGRPEKMFYRHYKLKEVQRNDDFAAMEEVLRRRIKRGLRDADLPDLLVIDGGRPQLRRVQKVLRELKVDHVDVVGLAKARRPGPGIPTWKTHERVWIPDAELPVILEQSSPVTHLLQRIRDEAHRFAITYSRRLKAQATVRSVLELIPGVGRRRRQALLKAFGDLAGVKRATVAQIAGLPEISEALAARIAAWLAENTLPSQDRKEDAPV